MDGLPGDTERIGDLLPGPTQVPRPIDVQRFEIFAQPFKRSDGLKAFSRVISTTGGSGQDIYSNHVVSIS